MSIHVQGWRSLRSGKTRGKETSRYVFFQSTFNSLHRQAALFLYKYKYLYIPMTSSVITGDWYLHRTTVQQGGYSLEFGRLAQLVERTETTDSESNQLQARLSQETGRRQKCCSAL